jgi:hypothetical protein
VLGKEIEWMNRKIGVKFSHSRSYIVLAFDQYQEQKKNMRISFFIYIFFIYIFCALFFKTKILNSKKDF